MLLLSQPVLTLRTPQLRWPVACRTHRHRRTVALPQRIPLRVHIHSKTKIRELGKMGESEEDVSGLDILVEVLALVQVIETLLVEEAGDEEKEGGEVSAFWRNTQHPSSHNRHLARYLAFLYVKFLLPTHLSFHHCLPSRHCGRPLGGSPRPGSRGCAASSAPGTRPPCILTPKRIRKDGRVGIRIMSDD
jgi:hypothetical protein